MKNKKVYVILIVLILIGSIFLTYNIYQNKNKVIKTKKRKQNNLAIMIKEDGATDYTKSNSKDIPKGNYVLNRDKSYCKNNGVIGDYDSVLGKVSFSFIGTDSCYLYFDYYFEPKGYEKILLDNGNGAPTVDEAKAYIEGRTTSTTPDFSTVTTTNEGMYSAKDDLGTSYYFRGAVDNNWLKYGKYTKDMYNCKNGTISATDTGNSCTKIASSGDAIYWRIIRINGDNSIRMIYSGITPPTESTKVIKTEDTSLGNSPFNSNYDSEAYVGYMYTIGEQYGTSQSSDIKTYLEDWYANYTDLNKTGTQITDQIFCNDRIISKLDPPVTSYGADKRLFHDSQNPGKEEPILTCPNEKDKFTSKGSSIGNKKLEYPVGLITADEVAMAGGKGTTDNSSYYLYTNQTYWSGSPCGFITKTGYGKFGALEFIASSSGALEASPGQTPYEVIVPPEDGSSFDSPGVRYGVRPVVSLSSKVKLSGNGTYNDVYTISGN